MTEFNESFPKGSRLLRKADFNLVYKEGIKSFDRCFVVIGVRNNCSTPRLGLAISRRCSNRSVKRNLIKRLVREIFRRTKNNLAGIDFVVLCKPCVYQYTNRSLSYSLNKLFNNVCHQLCGK